MSDPFDPNTWMPDDKPEPDPAPTKPPGKLTIVEVNWPLPPQDVEERRPTAARAEIDYHGISLSSRWGKAEELEAMMAAVDWVANHYPATVSMVEALWCDSNFGQLYTITCREEVKQWAWSIGEIFSKAFVAVDRGHNGLSLVVPDGESTGVEIYPDDDDDNPEGGES